MMEQVLERASSPPTCGLKQEGQGLIVWEGPLDGPEKKSIKYCARY